MNILARTQLPAPATWGLILACVVIGLILWFGRGKLDPVVRWVLLIVLVVLCALWIWSLLPVGDTSLP